jgi:hypothetical protein
MTYQIHPDLVGRSMPPAKRAELVSSIKEQGQLQPIFHTMDGYILEGSVRWQICLEINIVPKFHQLPAHSGLTKLPRTKAYAKSTQEEEREETEGLLAAFRPWSWSKCKKGQTNNGKTNNGQTNNGETNNGETNKGIHKSGTLMRQVLEALSKGPLYRSELNQVFPGKDLSSSLRSLKRSGRLISDSMPDNRHRFLYSLPTTPQ